MKTAGEWALQSPEGTFHKLSEPNFFVGREDQMDLTLKVGDKLYLNSNFYKSARPSAKLRGGKILDRVQANDFTHSAVIFFNVLIVIFSLYDCISFRMH